MRTEVDYVSFGSRARRAEYVAARFSRYLKGQVLDVGCDEAGLRELLPEADYTGVDVGGQPDVELDLEQAERLPFEDMAFDCVVCTDVLEHLDNLHHILGELVRVARGHVIVSLPNCWAEARRPIERGKGSFGHYGLPSERPMDRHKWFFSLSEARDFLAVQSERHRAEIVELHVTEKRRPSLVRAMRRIRYPREECYLNRYAQTLWAVLERHGRTPNAP